MLSLVRNIVTSIGHFFRNFFSADAGDSNTTIAQENVKDSYNDDWPALVHSNPVSWSQVVSTPKKETVTVRENDYRYNKESLKEDLYWGRNNKNFWYHYTSKYCAQSILKDLKIKITNSRIVRFGAGVFLTKMPPCVDEDELLANNYIHKSAHYRTKLEYVFAIKPNYLMKFRQLIDKFDPSRDIWKCDTDIDLNKCEFYLIKR